MKPTKTVWKKRKTKKKKRIMLRSIGKQSGESGESVQKKTRSSAIAE